MSFLGVTLKKDPGKEFEKEFGYTLPSTAEIIHYKYESKYDCFSIKISFDLKDLDYFKKNFSSYYSGSEVKPDYLGVNNEEIAWWEFNTADIIFSLQAWGQGKKGAKTRYIFVYIVDKQNENYDLYVEF